MEVDKAKETFAAQALQEGLRLDHRSLHQYRPFRVVFGPMHGKNIVAHLGNTRVSASVTYDLVEPSLNSPTTGFFDISITLKPHASHHGSGSKSTNITNAIRFALEQCLKGSGIIDVNSFVYIPGKVVGSLRLDVSVLNDDGNLIDCCSAAAQAALRHFRYHEITCDENNEIKIHSDRDPVPFVPKPIPLVVSIGCYGSKIIVDPNVTEMAFLDSLMNVCVAPNGRVAGVFKYGGQPVSADLLMECTNVAVTKGLKWLGFIDAMLEKDLSQRQVQFRSTLEGIKQAHREGEEV